jgi:hypothetical protein
MDIRLLPRYVGLPDSPKGWGEPDGHGKRPSVCLRDWVVLSLVLMIYSPICFCLAIQFWADHRWAESMNSAREKWMEEEMRRMAVPGLAGPVPHRDRER